MYSCINGATTMPYALEQDLEAAAKAGFDAVEIWSRKLDAYLENHDVAELKALLDSHGLRAASLCPYSLVGFSDNREQLRTIERAAVVAAAIECPTLLVCADAPPAGMDSDEAFSTMAAVGQRIRRSGRRPRGEDRHRTPGATPLHPGTARGPGGDRTGRSRQPGSHDGYVPLLQVGRRTRRYTGLFPPKCCSSSTSTTARTFHLQR